MSTTTRSLEISRAQGLFDGKVALITGGTSEIGAAIAKRVNNLWSISFFISRRVGEARRVLRREWHQPLPARH
jgi:NAD(P)-dependent dehydrogenase (short-subunit alcohol dehydrogenase family)